MTKTVGDLLREARNKKGLALQTIERSTGIATHNLLAIELDQFALIDEAQLESYLRTYAEAVGLDYQVLTTASGFTLTPSASTEQVAAPETQVTASAATVLPSPSIPAVQPATSGHLSRRATRQSGKEGSGGFFKVVVSLLLLAALVFAGFTLYKEYFANGSSKTEVSEPSSTSTAESSSTTASSSTAPSSSAPVAKFAITGGGDAITVNVTGAKKPVKIELSLTGAEQSWVSVSNSDLGEGGTLLNADKKSVTATMIEGANQSFIELGITQGLTIKVNGQTLDMSAITSPTTSAITLNVE